MNSHCLTKIFTVYEMLFLSELPLSAFDKRRNIFQLVLQWFEFALQLLRNPK